MVPERALTQWCGELGLDVPLVPAACGTLREVAPDVLATRELAWPPYAVDAWIGEASRGSVSDYALLGLGGHGVNSYALSYFVVVGRLRLFTQTGFGGVYMDVVEARDAVRACFEGARHVIEAASSAGGEPALVVATEFYGSWWQPLAGARRVVGSDGIGAMSECLRAAAAHPSASTSCCWRAR